MAQILTPWLENTNLDKLAGTADKICQNADTYIVNANPESDLRTNRPKSSNSSRP